MAGDGAEPGEEPQGGSRLGRSLYLCDLRPGLSEIELKQMFDNYGEVVVMEHIDCACEEAAVVEYRSSEAAEEAKNMLNFAVIRGKTARCMPLTSLESMQNSMDSGRRLVVENLDPAIEARGFYELCALWGPVLDCKVEHGDDDQPQGIGFVHFASADHADKAKAFMSGMQVGSSSVALRRYEPGDALLFTGCDYPWSVVKGAEQAEGAARGQTRRTPKAREQVCAEHFKTLEHHRVEVADGLQAKLKRLSALVEEYGPNQDQQMVVVMNSTNLQEVVAGIGGVVEAADVDSISSATGKEKLQMATDGFATGNVFVLALTSEVSVREDLGVRPPAVLVNFDLPSTIPLLLYRLYRRAAAQTKVHTFVSGTDGPALGALQAALEEAGLDVPVELRDRGSQSEEAQVGGE